jgi:signal transduction histidine kinase
MGGGIETRASMGSGTGVAARQLLLRQNRPSSQRTLARLGSTDIAAEVIACLHEWVQLDTDRLAWWGVLRDACRVVLNVPDGDLFLYFPNRHRLRKLVDSVDGYTLSHSFGVGSNHIAAAALRKRSAVDLLHAETGVEVGLPIYGQTAVDETTVPLAVLVLRFGRQASSAATRRRLLSRLDDLAAHIWPIAAYASMRQDTKLFVDPDSATVSPPSLNTVIDLVLDTICGRLGFTFGTISIVDEEQQEIRARRGKNVSEEWIRMARHRLDSDDIQADILRTGNVEVIAEWDPRLDAKIFNEFHHEDLVRVFVPLGRIGTIEAGFDRRTGRDSIDSLLVSVLKHYARDVTVLIQNALVSDLFERERHYAASLAELHKVTWLLQTGMGDGSETSLLQRITQACLVVLEADLVTLYPFDQRSGRFTADPIIAGAMKGTRPLRLPEGDDNIVLHLARTRKSYYQEDAENDPLVASSDDWRLHDSSGSPRRGFGERQKVLSFAGVPLTALGALFGVLCVNYRQKREFRPRDQQLMELFAQQASAVVVGGQLARERERRRLERDVHDWIKNDASAIIRFCQAAQARLDGDTVSQPDLERARAHIDDVRSAIWGIQADINVILDSLSAKDSTSRPLQALIQEDLDRLLGDGPPTYQLELGDNLPELGIEVTRELRSLLREAMSNSREHGKAAAIRVRLQRERGHLRLEVKDNGQGFTQGAILTGAHRGLETMRERAASIGAKLSITSPPRRGGTIVRVLVPLAEGPDGTAYYEPASNAGGHRRRRIDLQTGAARDSRTVLE